ncbi:MAG: hypothetical protein A2161_19965 [Candidatus Schekmanbacteria bacterium RBG_13_48_7]|uniref:Uncharacterized protein n=1 Tax=Candidatus Schekmanbacteria bacterium RBG_13_48_7 TaxID=1817878 RepID=A0A1F7S1N7_9BACT|nr:MAG: hypothetical protein A2161_19965 [Candidatus Schekmanbacteria bacterium RBG_13_48_7]
MRISKWENIILVLALLLLGFTIANAEVSISIKIGSGDYYNPVGDYDYLPYAYQTNPGFAAPRINFYDMMSQYGIWVTVAPFGRVWRPYATNDWRPYTYGHWIYLQQYGQTWEGYEPWAWAGYHYGNWIFDRNYGWVWIPGYDWHPGRVTWARSYGSIGWMPAPPSGYDYSRGYLSNIGPDNQFAYNDDDFSVEFGVDTYQYGGPYYNPRYRDMYYNPSYTQININLWIFIDNDHYGYDNYADYSLGREYTRHVFDRRLVRISNRPIDRPVLERLIGRRIQETQVQVRHFQTDKKNIRVVVPSGRNHIERVRKNGKIMVREIIAPGFAEKNKQFKGQNSRNKEVVSRIFHQENVKPKIETVSTKQIINQARKTSQNREQNRKKLEQAQQEKLIRIEKEGKVKEFKKEKAHEQQFKEKDQQHTKEQDQQKSTTKKDNDKTKTKDKDKTKKQQDGGQHTPKEK